MGEDMFPMAIYIGGEQVEVTNGIVDVGLKEESEKALSNGVAEYIDSHMDWKEENGHSFTVTIESDKAAKEIIDALGIKQDRIYTKAERKRFIRTVEHYGQVEFTLHDWQGSVDGFEQGTICIVCPTPKSVKTFLRMKGLGKVTYKITRRNSWKR